MRAMTGPCIVGVDLSTHALDLAYLTLDTNQHHWQHVQLAKGGAWTATRSVRPALGHHGLLGGNWDNVAAVYIEEPFSRGAKTAKALGLITGALIACIPTLVQIVERVPPHEWRRHLTGNPSSTKEQVKLHMLNQGYGQPDWPLDAFDALGLALAMRTASERNAA